MEQLVIVVIFIALSLLDMIGKAAKKRQQERRAEEVLRGGGDWPDESAVLIEGEDERSAAETMVPRDLWEEIAQIAGAQLDRDLGRDAEHESGWDESRDAGYDDAVEQESASEIVAYEPVSLEVPARDLERELAELRESRARVPVEYRGHSPAARRAEHYVHLAHAEYGTDPSERAPSGSAQRDS